MEKKITINGCPFCQNKTIEMKIEPAKIKAEGMPDINAISVTSTCYVCDTKKYIALDPLEGKTEKTTYKVLGVIRKMVSKYEKLTQEAWNKACKNKEE